MATRALGKDEKALAASQGGQGGANRSDISFTPVDRDRVTGTDDEAKDGIIEERTPGDEGDFPG